MTVRKVIRKQTNQPSLVMVSEWFFVQPLITWSAESFIEELYDQGITGGYLDGSYRPENQVTRAEMAVLLVNAFNIPLPCLTIEY
jgi:hypothetical protein